jgi:hypothetical protein
MRRLAFAAVVCLAAGVGSCSKSSTITAVTGVGNTLLVLSVQPSRFGEIGTCNQFQLSVTATDANGKAVVIDSSVWTSGDSTAISVTRTGGLLTSHFASSAVTITTTAWAGTKFGGATSLWTASPNAVQILDPNGNPYPEPPCPDGSAAADAARLTDERASVRTFPANFAH